MVSTVKWWGPAQPVSVARGGLLLLCGPRLPVRAGFCKECEADVAEVVGRYGGVGCM